MRLGANRSRRDETWRVDNVEYCPTDEPYSADREHSTADMSPFAKSCFGGLVVRQNSARLCNQELAAACLHSAAC
jgi:hypothetical protein